MCWQIQETRRRSGLEDMFVVCKSISTMSHAIITYNILKQSIGPESIFIYLSLQILAFLTNALIASSYSYLTFELLKEKWVFYFLLRYSRDEKLIYVFVDHIFWRAVAYELPSSQ